MFQRQILRSSRAACSSLKQLQIPRTQQQQILSFSSLHQSGTRSAHPLTSRPQYTSRRWQSGEAKTEDQAEGDAAKAAEDRQPTSSSSSEDALKQEIEKKNKEIVDLKDKYLRSVADYRNLQDRSKREQTSARQFAIQKFATDLLDSIDNLDRALSAVPKESLQATSSSEPNKDLQNLYNGLKMTEEIMMGVLKKHGLEKYDPLEREGGPKFDPNLDEATFFTKVEGKGDGEVFYTQSKGYTLNGRVIRASKVGVVKNN